MSFFFLYSILFFFFLCLISSLIERQQWVLTGLASCVRITQFVPRTRWSGNPGLMGDGRVSSLAFFTLFFLLFPQLFRYFQSICYSCVYLSLPPTYEVRGKVMFSPCLSVHWGEGRGGGTPTRTMTGYPPPHQPWSGQR